MPNELEILYKKLGVTGFCTGISKRRIDNEILLVDPISIVIEGIVFVDVTLEKSGDVWTVVVTKWNNDGVLVIEDMESGV